MARSQPELSKARKVGSKEWIVRLLSVLYPLVRTEPVGLLHNFSSMRLKKYISVKVRGRRCNLGRCSSRPFR